MGKGEKKAFCRKKPQEKPNKFYYNNVIKFVLAGINIYVYI